MLKHTIMKILSAAGIDRASSLGSVRLVPAAWHQSVHALVERQSNYPSTTAENLNNLCLFLEWWRIHILIQDNWSILLNQLGQKTCSKINSCSSVFMYFTIPAHRWQKTSQYKHNAEILRGWEQAQQKWNGDSKHLQHKSYCVTAESTLC